jgi:hypothetical protein
VATLAYSLPGVGSFSYFRSHGSFMQHGDVYDGTQPLPVVETLCELVDRWHPRGETMTDADGRIQLPGLGGRYLVEPIAPGPGGETADRIWWADVAEARPLAADGEVDADAAVADLRPERRPEPAPDVLADFGPWVTAEHALDLQIEPLDPAAEVPRPQGAVRQLDAVMPVRWERRSEEPSGMWRLDDGAVAIGGALVSGFCLDAVPAGMGRLHLILSVPDRGTPVDLSVHDRTRRFVRLGLAPGRYRLTMPVEAESRPALHLAVPIGLRHLYGFGGTEQHPYGILTQAWIIPAADGPPPPAAPR